MPSTQRILLVDDDPSIRASLTFSLELEGYRVDAYESGEAVMALESLPEDGCLVLDYRLTGMDGLALLALLRGKGVALPAIIITTSPTRSIHARAAEARVAIIEKPLLGDCLTTAIRSALVKSARAA